MSDVAPPSAARGKALLSPAQIRGAPGMLDWPMADLARSARLSVSTIERMEMTAAQPTSDGAFAALRSALRAATARPTAPASAKPVSRATPT